MRPAQRFSAQHIMGRLRVIGRAGDERAFEAMNDISIMENIRDNGFDDLVGVCGGNCACGTCHIYVDDGEGARLPPMSADEDSMLACSEHRTARSRLACQIPFGPHLDGLRVRLAPEE